VPAVAGLALFFGMTVAAHADTGPTPVGAGFTGIPTVLTGDMVLEDTGLYSVIRAYVDASEPAWFGIYNHSSDGFWGEVLYSDGLIVALRRDSPAGLDIVDASDLSALAPLGELAGTRYTGGWLDGTTLIVTSSGAIVRFDLSEPASPAFAGAVALAPYDGPSHVTVIGDRLYCLDRPNRLRVVDLGDPVMLRDLGSVTLDAGRVDALTAREGLLHALVALSGSGGTTIALDTYAVDGGPLVQRTDRRVLATGPELRGRGLVADSGLLVAASAQVDGFVFDADGIPVPAWQLPVAAERLALAASQLLVTTGDGTLQIYPRAAGSTPPGPPLDRLPLPLIQAIDGQGPLQTAQSREDRSLLLPIDVTNPALPRLGPPFDTGIDGTFEQFGDLGLMFDSAGILQLVDLSDPGAPALAGRVEDDKARFLRMTPGPDVVAVETLTDDLRIRLYDVSDPAAPRAAATEIRDFGVLAVGEGLMVMRRQNRIDLYDISDLDRPKNLSSLPVSGGVMDAAIDGGFIYVLCDITPDAVLVHAVDAREPRELQLLSTVRIDRFAARIEVHAERVYVSGFRWGSIVSIADPTDLRAVGEFRMWGETGLGLAFNGDVTTVSGWLLTMRDESFSPTAAREPGQQPQVPAASRLLGAAPNPFNPSTTIRFAVDRTRDLTVTVHDVRGRRVAELARGTFGAGEHAVSWHGRDAAGLPAASGVYLVRLHGPGVESVGTITLVK
jgi:hypothetical protein